MRQAAFSAAVSTSRLFDLTSEPLARNSAQWTNVTDYGPCVSFADAARAADADAIRYRSVRDPGEGMNLALLLCRALASPAPIERQTWRIRLSPSGVQALCELPRQAIEFPRDTFAADPRIAALAWNREHR